MLLHEQIERVRDIKNCPSCGSPWEAAQGIHTLLSKYFNNEADKWLKGTEYVAPREGRFYLHLVHFIFAGNSDDPMDNFYACPNCDEMWRLSDGLAISGIEKGYIAAVLPGIAI